jgi:hypothetical protein
MNDNKDLKPKEQINKTPKNYPKEDLNQEKNPKEKLDTFEDFVKLFDFDNIKITR